MIPAIAIMVMRAAIADGTLNFPNCNEVKKFISGLPISASTADTSIHVRILLKYHARNSITAVIAQMTIYFESLFIISVYLTPNIARSCIKREFFCLNFVVEVQQKN